MSASELSKRTQVLLPTAKVKLISQNGEEIIVKALLDSASQSSFITSSVARAIGKQPIPNHIDVVGIANTGKTIRHALQLDIFSCAYPYKVRANLLLVDQITSKLPQHHINLAKLKLPSNIKLADDSFNITSDIGILLGADVFFQALLPQTECIQLTQDEDKGDAAQPSLLHTQFGYIVAGSVPDSYIQSSAVALFCQECETDISATIANFWQSEKVPEKFVEHTSEQQYVEKHFTDTVKLENNQFEVSMPLKLPLCDMNNALGESLGLALKRFLNLENKLQKDKPLQKEYKSFIHEYLELGHASIVDITLYDLSKDPVYFFAHHAVIKQDAITTKLRTVFDGSMKTNNKISLNDLMWNGPIVQQELFDILLLFRLHKHFFACDIRRMFRNLIIEKSQRSLLNILWRDSPDEQLKCIQLSTVPYGLKCSSWLATRCLLELATRFGKQYPLAAPVLLNSTYVDDVLHTDDSLARIIATKAQLIELLNKGNFQLHKWSANHKAILAEVPEQHQNSGDLEFNNDIKTLGLKFCIQQDSFIITCPPACDIPKTKRQILSYISKFYDPMGIAGPILVQAKVIMQKLWTEVAISWDTVLPTKLQDEWLQFYNSLQQMAQISAPRNVCPENSKIVQIIGFSDAAIAAMGCAIYLRVVDNQGRTTVSLLCSKSKIAPKSSKMSIPRLELNAALLLAKLSARVHGTLSKKIKIDNVHLYSDSQVVLAWQKTDPVILNAYVANRIKIINDLTMSFKWAYVASDSNPADFLTKPYAPTELQCNQLWWSGPSFLKDSDYQIDEFNHKSTKNLPEVKDSASEKLVCAASQERPKSFLDLLIEKYSNLDKLVNVLAYILRHKGVTAKQLMGSLPADRVNISRCFKKIGLDFAGPVAVKQSRMRGVITSHAYLCAPLNCIPEQDFTNIPENRLSFWSKCTAMQQHFWRYWSKHYLNVLQNRPKWKDSQPNVKVKVAHITIVDHGEDQSLNEHCLGLGRKDILQAVKHTECKCNSLTHGDDLGSPTQTGVNK
ncbi:uncharacterized protein LOC114240381 [Bombyx mandarina]|uniref:Uncharacterized protein LOC114240381 n=1 Tax=Bombyx mandarina TaxID=7092 RepID=A0A6J2JBL1_BOMMA|nr:uncharacterized protein LOC114240381 [Bombyx mandarina]